MTLGDLKVFRICPYVNAESKGVTDLHFGFGISPSVDVYRASISRNRHIVKLNLKGWLTLGKGGGSPRKKKKRPSTRWTLLSNDGLSRDLLRDFGRQWERVFALDRIRVRFANRSGVGDGGDALRYRDLHDQLDYVAGESWKERLHRWSRAADRGYDATAVNVGRAWGTCG